jgi:MFS family permease
VVLDATIVNVALPHIQRALGFSGSGLEWVVNAYALAFGGLLLLGGRAGDLLGRRRMFIAGLLVFSAASLAGGFATSQAWLLAARAIQGIGGALTAPAALSLVTTTFPAFENYPPGQPGKNLRLAAMMPRGLFVAMQAMRVRAVRRSPLGSGHLCAGGAAPWAGKATSPHGPCGGYIAGAGASLVWRMNSRMAWANAAGWSRMMSV